MRSTRTLSSRDEQALFKNGLGGAISQYRNKQIIYLQGKTANTLFFVREGNVLLTIRSKGRQPAAITLLGPGDFFGQSCLAGVPLRICTATAIGSCSVLIIKKREMIHALRGDHIASHCFVSYLLSLSKEYQEHMVDLLVHSSEQRLAHVLLQLAKLSSKGGRIPRISQGVLATMVGTTRGRINVLMNRFRKRGLVGYNGEIKIHGSLRAVYLHHRGIHESI